MATQKEITPQGNAALAPTKANSGTPKTLVPDNQVLANQAVAASMGVNIPGVKGQANPFPVKTTVNASRLGTPTVTVPTPPPATPSTGNLGMVNNAATAAVKTDSSYEPPENKGKLEASSLLKKLTGDISGQASAEDQIRKDEQLAEKKQRAVAISNELEQLDKTFRDEVTALRQNPEGKLAGGVEADVARAQDRYENRRANISLAYRVAAGDYQGAQEIANEKVSSLRAQNAQSLQAYQLFVDSVNNDLTESEKLTVQENLARKRFAYESMENAYQSVLEAARMNNAPASVLNAIDTAKDAPGATAASIAAAAGQYGGDILGDQYKKAQIANVYADNERSSQEKSQKEKNVFTTTQINNGAQNAGIPIEDFKTLPTDVQNFYISSPQATITTIEDALAAVKSGEDDADTAKTDIDSLSLAPAVKQHLKDLVDQNAPAKKEETGLLNSVVNGIKSFFGY